MRPFTCKECKRTFSRQDSLARHEKLHLRTDGTKYAISPSASTPLMSLPALPTPEHSVDTTYTNPSGSSAASIQGWNLNNPSVVDDASFIDMSQNADLDFQLIWPDSEELFQSLMAVDTASHIPLGTLPMSSNFDNVTPRDLFEQNRSATEAIPSGGGHQAVHGVSKMISALVRNLCLSYQLFSLIREIVIQRHCRSRGVIRDLSLPRRMSTYVLRALYTHIPNSTQADICLSRLYASSLVECHCNRYVFRSSSNRVRKVRY